MIDVADESAHDDCKASALIVRCSWTLLDLQAATHAVIQAAAMLHSSDLVHSDLRAENILWRHGKPFLTDLEQVHEAGYEVRLCTLPTLQSAFWSGRRKAINTWWRNSALALPLNFINLLKHIKYALLVLCRLHANPEIC